MIIDTSYIKCTCNIPISDIPNLHISKSGTYYLDWWDTWSVVETTDEINVLFIMRLVRTAY